MLTIYPFPVKIILLKKKNSKYNINACGINHYIV